MKKLVYVLTISMLLSCENQELGSNTKSTPQVNHMVDHADQARNDILALEQIVKNLGDYSDTYYSYPIKYPEGYTPLDYNANKEAFSAFKDLRKLLKVCLNEEIPNDNTIKDFLSARKNKEYYFKLAQWSALVMLDQKLLKIDSQMQDKSAIAFYSNMLLDQEYHHSEVLAKSLHALKGYWSKEMIEENSRVCLQRTTEYNLGHESSISSIKESNRIGIEMLNDLLD